MAGPTTEVVLALRIRTDVDPALLGALSRWRVGEGPRLPRPSDPPRRERAVADAVLADASRGGVPGLNADQYAYVIGALLSDRRLGDFPIPPSIALRYDRGAWTLAPRFPPQTRP